VDGECGLRGVVFRIDKDETFGEMGQIRDNLAQLFYADGDSRRLSLVVDLTPPVSTTEPPSLPPSTSHLNLSQLSASSKVLSAENYLLYVRDR
jgi:DNA replication ATP-dependent helicase Dna2